MKTYIYNIWSKYWVGIVLITFLVLFFGKIAINAVNHHEYLLKFAVKCKDKGGVMFVPRGVRGWPVAECRNPNFTITIDMGDK